MIVIHINNCVRPWEGAIGAKIFTQDFKIGFLNNDGYNVGCGSLVGEMYIEFY